MYAIIRPAQTSADTEPEWTLSQDAVPTLEQMQNIVGEGLQPYMHHVDRLALDDDVDLWFHDDGIALCPPTLALVDGERGWLLTILHGPVIALSHDGPETTALQPEQWHKLTHNPNGVQRVYIMQWGEDNSGDPAFWICRVLDVSAWRNGGAA